jgi:transposase
MSKQKNDDRDAEGNRGGGDTPDHAVCRAEEPGAARHADASAIERPPGRRTDGSDQSGARDPFGVAPQGKRKLEQFLTVLMDEQRGAGLSPRMITRVADARAQWAGLDQRIAAFDTEFIRWTKENEDARRLASIPGVGPTIASALIAAIGKGETFEHGRDLAAGLGLVPPQFATGGRPKLLGVSKNASTTRSF